MEVRRAPPHPVPTSMSQRTHEGLATSPRTSADHKVRDFNGSQAFGALPWKEEGWAYLPPGPAGARSCRVAVKRVWPSGTEWGTVGKPPAGKATTKGEEPCMRRERQPSMSQSPPTQAGTNPGDTAWPRRQWGLQPPAWLPLQNPELLLSSFTVVTERQDCDPSYVVTSA